MCVIFMSYHQLSAAEISGTVRDEKTGEPIIGARVSITGTAKGAVSGLDGSYRITNVSDGRFTLHTVYSGFHPRDTVITLSSSGDRLIVNVGLAVWIARGMEVTVTARAERGSDADAQITERNAENVISTTSARAIEISPDISVANVTQRMSGVTMTRNSNGD